MTPATGGTQCWLGSHLETAAANLAHTTESEITLADLAELRRETHPPMQLTVPKGACAFRDLRVWHCGMPNHGDIPRHMISLGYGSERDPTAECSHLGQGKHKHLFSEDTRAAFERVPSQAGKPVLVDRLASFVVGPIDHFGNPDPAGPSYTARDEDGVLPIAI